MRCPGKLHARPCHLHSGQPPSHSAATRPVHRPHPTSYILHPTPYILHPTPSLHPILHPTYTLHPTPSLSVATRHLE
eukprot:7388048-Prymnesium_polylepis.1